MWCYFSQWDLGDETISGNFSISASFWVDPLSKYVFEVFSKEETSAFSGFVIIGFKKKRVGIPFVAVTPYILRYTFLMVFLRLVGISSELQYTDGFPLNGLGRMNTEVLQISSDLDIVE
jgi:hypothetical protein